MSSPFHPLRDTLFLPYGEIYADVSVHDGSGASIAYFGNWYYVIDPWTETPKFVARKLALGAALLLDSDATVKGLGSKHLDRIESLICSALTSLSYLTKVGGLPRLQILICSGAPLSIEPVRIMVQSP